MKIDGIYLKEYILNELIKIGWQFNKKNIIVSTSKIDLANTFIRQFGGLKYYNNYTDTHYNFSISSYDTKINDIPVSRIATLNNGILGILKFGIDTNGNIYIINYKEKFASSINEFFEKIFSHNSYINLRINDKTYEILKNAGWYYNRFVDISGFVKKMSDNNIKVFPSAKKFYQEFYGLHGYTYNFCEDNSLPWKVFDENEILNFHLCTPIYKLYKSNELCFPICHVDHYSIKFYISENGFIYDNREKLIGKNSIEGLNNIFQY